MGGAENVAHAAKPQKDSEGRLEGPEGLKYKDIDEGDGPAVKATDVPKITYVIKLASSGEEVKSKQAIPFQPGKNKIIKGLELAVLGGSGMAAMQVGGVRNVIVPPSLGFGDKGDGSAVPPDSLLDVTVTLLSTRSQNR